jgi:hypothetical protein
LSPSFILLSSRPNRPPPTVSLFRRNSSFTPTDPFVSCLQHLSRGKIDLSWADSFQSTLQSISLWISSFPSLPLKWSQSLEKISQKSKTRLKKCSEVVEDIYLLSDGRIWADFISKDIHFIFQLLMIQEGKKYLNCVNLEQFSSDHDLDIQRKQQFYHKYQSKALSNCSFDRIALTFFQFLDDRNYLTLDSSNQDVPLLNHSHHFFVNLAQNHPSLFLRYQSIIKYYLTKPLMQSQNKLNSAPAVILGQVKPTPAQPQGSGIESKSSQLFPKDKQHSNDLPISFLPAPLPVTVNPPQSTAKDNKMSGPISTTRNLLFTANGCEVNSILWETLLQAYESCDYLIWYLHSTTSNYCMDRVYEVFLECAERREVCPRNCSYDLILFVGFYRLNGLISSTKY